MCSFKNSLADNRVQDLVLDLFALPKHKGGLKPLSVTIHVSSAECSSGETFQELWQGKICNVAVLLKSWFKMYR